MAGHRLLKITNRLDVHQLLERTPAAQMPVDPLPGALYPGPQIHADINGEMPMMTAGEHKYEISLHEPMVHLGPPCRQWAGTRPNVRQGPLFEQSSTCGLGYNRPMSRYEPTSSPAWRHLTTLAEASRQHRITDYFGQEPRRMSRFTARLGSLFVDFSKHLINEETRTALVSLARQAGVEAQRDAMFRGEPINVSEQRAVRHTALRATPPIPEVASMQDAMYALCSEIRSGRWSGHDGRPITDIVNIGIGGSDLGPKMVCTALTEFARPGLKLHFISNVDGEPLLGLLRALDPGSTLFIVSSKSFTTQETLLNMDTAVDWFRQKTGLGAPLESGHFIAVTTRADTARQIGIPDDRILQFQDWVGGRYSLWSAIGVSICMSIGPEHFKEMLAGAHQVDRHFCEAPLDHNLPVLLALAGIWYQNFLGAGTHAIVPYCERLSFLPAFVQQLDMESNGKGVTLTGEPINHDTGAIVWGQTGTNGQHAFFQLLHQGTRLVPVDFIGLRKDHLSHPEHHRVLLANMIAQAAALLAGKPGETPHQQYPGNRPSTTFLLDELTPASLGQMIALYEHQVFCQGVIWNINSFDQWGVELGKQLATDILEGHVESADPSTLGLLNESGLAGAP